MQACRPRAAGAAASDAWRGAVFLWQQRSLYLGAAGDTSLHASHDVKVCLALHGQFRLRLAGTSRWQTCAAALIPSDEPHQLDGRGAQLALLYFSPELIAGERLSYAGRRVQPVAPRLLARFTPHLRRYLQHGCTEAEATELCAELIDALLPAATARLRLDARVAETLAGFDAAPAEQPHAAELAAAVALSPGRLAHLFSAQVGLPVRQYLLQLRLRRALRQMNAPGSLTHAAHAAGFADSAHLSRTFRRTVGLAPSALTRHSRFFRLTE
ncbi:MAG TPA: helix-turn-helix domain-containing protein [Pyrinomonadaceae bacterium]